MIVQGALEWENTPIQTKFTSVLGQFVSLSMPTDDADSLPFMLKTKRLEYTFEYFRSLL